MGLITNSALLDENVHILRNSIGLFFFLKLFQLLITDWPVVPVIFKSIDQKFACFCLLLAETFSQSSFLNPIHQHCMAKANEKEAK